MRVFDCGLNEHGVHCGFGALRYRATGRVNSRIIPSLKNQIADIMMFKQQRKAGRQAGR